MMEDEIWKDIAGYEGLYQVSSLGKVKSLNYRRTEKEKILKPVKNRKGYLIVNLHKNHKQKIFAVHRLVATAFIDNPENKSQIDHINTIRTDNRVDNLRWTTPKENNNNILTISKRYGANSCVARKVLQFTKEGIFVREWNCIADAWRELGIAQQSISQCCLCKQKTAYNYVWKYA